VASFLQDDETASTVTLALRRKLLRRHAFPTQVSAARHAGQRSNKRTREEMEATECGLEGHCCHSTNSNSQIHLTVTALRRLPGEQQHSVFDGMPLDRVMVERQVVVNAWLASKVRKSALDLRGIKLYTDARPLLRALAELNTLRTLHLECERVSVQGGILLAPALAQLKSLQSLLLKCLSGTEAVMRLAPALAKLQALQTLHLPGNFCAELIMHLARHLSKLSALQTLDMSRNRMKDKGLEFLSLTLSKLTQLQAHNVSGNSFGAQGMQKLAQHLHKLSALQELDVSGNTIGDQGAEYLSHVLTGLTTLQHLHMNVCAIGRDGVKVLAPALAKLTNLRSLHLCTNCIAFAGAMDLGSHLAKLPTLKLLSLESNELEEFEDEHKHLMDQLVELLGESTEVLV
jgi:hypothetical protein